MDNISKEKESKQECEQDYAQEKEIFLELYKQNRQEEEESRQKSWCLWLKAGDKNTVFFHNIMKIRRDGNQIEKIQVDGQEVKGIEEIKKATHNHYKSLLSTINQQVDSEEFLQQIKKKSTSSKTKN